MKGETVSREDDNNNEDTEGGMEAEGKKKTKKGKAKQATDETLATIADDCDNVLAFFQAVAVKSTLVIAAPLSFHSDKRGLV